MCALDRMYLGKGVRFAAERPRLTLARTGQPHTLRTCPVQVQGSPECYPATIAALQLLQGYRCSSVPLSSCMLAARS